MTKRNRKKEHYGSFLNINGEELKINSTEKLGVYPLIIEKFVVELDKMIAYLNKVL